MDGGNIRWGNGLEAKKIDTPAKKEDIEEAQDCSGEVLTTKKRPNFGWGGVHILG